jgi:hypothetical protein
VATHCSGGSINNRAGSGEWECEERGGDYSHDIGLVRVWLVGGGDARAAGHDPEYSITGPVDGRGMISFLASTVELALLTEN